MSQIKFIPAVNSDQVSNNGILNAILGAVVLAVSVLFIYKALLLENSEYEPYGAATFPVLICGITSVISAILLFVGVRQVFANQVEFPNIVDGSTKQLFRVCGLVGVVIAYVVLLSVFELSYWIATSVFLVSAIWVQKSHRVREIATTAIAAVIVAVLLQVIFTKVVVVDLPL